MPKVPKRSDGSKRTPSSKATTSSTANPSKWIPTEKPLPLPQYVREAIQKLTSHGHVAYVVGGSVRDFLIGKKEAKDHDIATGASVDEIEKLFPEGIAVGKQFGVIKVPVGEGHPLLEIATFRQDLEYKDHRHPQGVRQASPAEDAARRDFTINALYYDPKTGRVLDLVEGMKDLKAGVVRAIGQPKERFREDALRLLRAVRLTTQLGFRLDPATADAARARSRLLGKISAERVRDELTLMWTGPRPHLALQLLSELDLLLHCLPEVDRLRREKSVWSRLIRTLEALAETSPSRSLTLGWSAVLSEIGREGADPEKVALRLRLSKDDAARIAENVETYQRFKEVFQMREATLQRFIRQKGFQEALELHRASAIAGDGNLAYYEFCVGRFEEMKKLEATSSAPRKLISGEDLIQLGFRPGPKFSEILRTIEDLSLEGKLGNKEEALEYVVRHFAT